MAKKEKKLNKFLHTPETLRIQEELPENKRCEECGRRHWVCTCAVELDELQIPE